MKKCITCKEEKEFEKFSLRNSGKPNSECKICSAKRSNEWYYANKKRSLENRKKYYEEHKQETLIKCKEYYIENREKIRKLANEKNRTPERRKKSNERIKKWNKKNPDKRRNIVNRYNKKNPEKKIARQSVMWAIKLGFMKKPSKCEICKKEIQVEAHHKNYNKPLEVNWFCRLCHMKLHHKDNYEFVSTS